MDGIQIFNRVINNNLIKNGKFLTGRTNYISAYTRIFRSLNSKEKLRAEILRDEDLTVPPILIISVTNNCNLACAGCYASAQGRDLNDEMTASEIDRIVGEAVEAGVGIVFIAGGEPLMKEGLLELPRKYGDVLFVMFTNGLLIDEEKTSELKSIRNLVLAFSLEGDSSATDRRRGAGVYSAVKAVMEKLNEDKLMFGASITLTRENYESVMNPDYLQELDDSGCRALFLIEYVPCEGDPELCITEEQKTDLLVQIDLIRKKYSMLPIALPGDEQKFGGCLAAGRGFLHISSSGAVEACPFAPFSDINLREVSFKEALASRLLGRIRENHHLLKEAEGGCTLFENMEWVKELAAT
ncbi:MAG: radical SAM protein [Spirochaetales bacterium]|nr:radical SAM protein [Spirochaetales bacterium]